MGKGPNLVTDIGRSPNIDHAKDMAENGAPEAATKIVYVVVILGLIALVALVGIGLHIPAE